MKTLNEIKKALYKEKPIATTIGDGIIISSDSQITAREYTAKLEDGTDLKFTVPYLDMGDVGFEKELPAQLLIRWLIWS